MKRLLWCGGWLFAGCANPSINLATKEPIKVDIDVRLDVYQHEGAKPEAKTADSPTEPLDRDTKRRARMGEVQTFKNSRLIGEAHTGLLSVRSQPPGEYGEYVAKTVEAENADRLELMAEMAKQEATSIEAIQSRQAKLFRERAFNGEWVEVEEGGGLKWAQKGE